ncbi:MAG: tRNA (N6-isopentenyl adenosine(37)-C2)-methylthiotransferase MiaB [Gammaproteobacteria bacterium]
MREKLFVRTFGCQMNAYDSARIADVLGGSADAAQSIEEADIVLFNTCSVREKAQEKVFSDLGRARQLKERNKNLIIGVGGCVASQEGGAILERAPYVDVVFGPQTLHRLPQMIKRRRQSGKAQVDVSFPEMEKFDNLPPPSFSPPSAFVSIMEGCSKYCSFCVVPYTRGEEISRPLAGVLDEVARHAANGAREVVLLGQNVNAYRAAIDNHQADGGIADFAALLECVCAIPAIERVRFTTSHPAEFGERLINAFASLPKLADHIHLPVQSGSDRILAAMKRGYTAIEYKSIIRQIRRARPQATITSDFIIGFPGESDDDFAKTMKLVDDVGFDFSYSFLYSPRPGTPAATLPDDTPEADKKHRLMQLQDKLAANGRKTSEQMVGRVYDVLAEGAAKRGRGFLSGRTSNNRTVNFRADDADIGKMLPVRIVEATAHALRGEVDTKTTDGAC